jgi:hypothetical protein
MLIVSGAWDGSSASAEGAAAPTYGVGRDLARCNSGGLFDCPLNASNSAPESTGAGGSPSIELAMHPGLVGR